MSTDDQLPDYVMIMVTNKKSEKQMVEDLDLFLGGTESALKFVEWLNAEIKRVAAGQDKMAAVAATAAPSKPSKSSVSRKSSATNNSSHESDELAIQVEAGKHRSVGRMVKTRRRLTSLSV